MTRRSPLVVAVVTLAPLVLGAEVCAVYRSRHRPPPIAASEPPEEPARPTPTAELAVTPPAPPPLPAPRLGDGPPSPPAAAAPAQDPSASGKRPLFVAPGIETVIRDADELVFEKLAVDDATRAAIRQINQEHEAKLRALRSGEAAVPSEESPPGNDSNLGAFRQTRRAALQELLGAGQAVRFETAEHVATKHLHNQYRRQSLEGIPPGGPASNLQ